MRLNELLGKLPPPASPVETHGVAWSEVERQVGSNLPDDYKEFIGQYGSGRINNFIWVLNPFASNENINLLHQMAVQLQSLKTLAEDFGEPCPYLLFPQSGGLLPFAMTDNGDVLHWVTEGNPNDWRIVVNEARGPEFEEFNLNTLSFLAMVLTREKHCSVFPRSLAKGNPEFVPIQGAAA